VPPDPVNKEGKGKGGRKRREKGDGGKESETGKERGREQMEVPPWQNPAYATEAYLFSDFNGFLARLSTIIFIY
jgi:hypothetical protein